MYELFILGELMDQPLHGYLLHEIISMAIGPVRQMSWGALYPLIRQLEQSGYIEPAGEACGASGGRQRKVYRITEAGRQRFFALMLKPEDYSTDYPDLFNIKMVNFDHLTPAQRMTILQHYRGYVQYLCDHHRTGRQYVATNPHILEAERAYILRAIDHRSHLAAADLAWIDGEIARLAPTEGQTASPSKQMHIT